MSTILIPTDFSDNARNAFEYGLALLGTDHTYILYNSYEEPKTAATSMISLRDILMEASEDSLREEKAYFEQKCPGINIKTVSEYGDPVTTVSNYARRHQTELIIMGTAGVTGLEKIFLGSVAAAVITKAPCPVIVVPKGYEYSSLDKVLFTADLSNAEQEGLPDVFRDLMAANSSNITILTVNGLDEEIDQERAEKGFDLHVAMNGFDHKFEVVTSEDVEEAIRTYAHDNGMKMLVTTPHKSTWFSRLFNPSVSKELAEHLEIPMLALH